MTPPRPAEHYVHGGGEVVVVPARVAAWLDSRGLSTLRVNARGADPEVDAVLAALHLASLHWRTSVRPEAAAEVAKPQAEVASGLTWMTTTQAADRIGIGDRAVRLAISEGRLSAEQIDGRWRIARDDVEHFRAARAS